jgi:hypothetical protein
LQKEFKETDWKLFRKKLPGWQEAYMARLNKEYIELLSGPGTASDKFWELEKRINRDKKSVGVVAQMSRSNMYMNILALLSDGAIGLDDLDGFSEDLREKMAFIMRDR